jgi:hypothetical protein
MLLTNQSVALSTVHPSGNGTPSTGGTLFKYIEAAERENSTIADQYVSSANVPIRNKIPCYNSPIEQPMVSSGSEHIERARDMMEDGIQVEILMYSLGHKRN